MSLEYPPPAVRHRKTIEYHPHLHLFAPEGPVVSIDAGVGINVSIGLRAGIGVGVGVGGGRARAC